MQREVCLPHFSIGVISWFTKAEFCPKCGARLGQSAQNRLSDNVGGVKSAKVTTAYDQITERSMLPMFVLPVSTIAI